MAKRKKKKELPLPMKFNPGLQKYEPSFPPKEKGVPLTKKQKFSNLIKLLIVLAVIAIVTLLIILPLNKKSSEDKLIGGQKDSYGCLVAAGYSYDSVIGACIRPWEISQEDQRHAASLAVEKIGKSPGLTVSEIVPAQCNSCFTVILIDSNFEQFQVKIENWQVK